MIRKSIEQIANEFKAPRDGKLIDEIPLKETALKKKGAKNAYEMTQEEFYKDYTKNIEDSLTTQNILLWRYLVIEILNEK